MDKIWIIGFGSACSAIFGIMFVQEAAKLRILSDVFSLPSASLVYGLTSLSCAIALLVMALQGMFA